MATLNLTPVLDALGGPAATPAVFKAEARRAGRRATRVNGAEVTFATELIAVWDGTAWNTPPTLFALPVDCYWNVKVQASGNRLEVNGILPSTADTVDFGDLIPITPDTGQHDTSTRTQLEAAQQYVSNQVGHIDAVAATIFDTVATIQGQIDTAAQQVQQAGTALALVQTTQAEIDDDLNTVVAAATQTAADRAATAAARTAAETAAASITAQVDAAVAGLVAGAPGALDTLNELAAALGDDANFATTVANALATKAPLASPTFTGTVTGITKTMVGLSNVDNTADSNKPVSTAQAAADTAAKARANHTGTQPASTITGLAAVATTGSYTDLTNIPTVLDGNG